MRPVTDLRRSVAPFKVVTDMEPAGDQPAAIAELEKRVTDGSPHAVLLAATGTGKTATVACLAQRVQRPTLVRMQYVRNDLAFSRGTFGVRGDPIEVIRVYEEHAVRVEMFGDEIERLMTLHPLAGEVVTIDAELYIFPASHYVAGPERMERAIAGIEAELGDRLGELEQAGKLLEAQRLRMRTSYDVEMMRQVGSCAGIENYSRHIDGREAGSPPNTLLDYFPEDFLLVIDESHVTVPQIGAMYEGDVSRKRVLVEHGFRLPSAIDNRPLTCEELCDRIDQTLYLSATPGPYELGRGK